MRAVAIREPGGPEVLEVVHRIPREPGPGEVSIRVAAAAVNPTDLTLRRQGGGDLPRPWIPGMDAAGTVTAVGAGVTRLTVGQPVMAAITPRRSDGGAQAEVIVAPEASVVPAPDGVTLEQASTLPMNGLTALAGLRLLDLQEGQTLAISGGAGLLASYAIPLAKERGLTTVADANPEDATLLTELGADHVVERGEGFTASVRQIVPNGADGLLDTARLEEAALPAVRDGGVVASVGGWTPHELHRGIEVRKVSVADVLARTDWLEQLRALATSGNLQLRVAGTFPPERAGDAHQLMQSGGLRGRAVITFGS